MPDHLTDRIYRMCADRWLENYGSYQGLTRVFGYLFRRAKFPSHLDKATIVLEKLEEPLDDIFQTYFPKLETYVQGEIKLI